MSWGWQKWARCGATGHRAGHCPKAAPCLSRPPSWASSGSSLPARAVLAGRRQSWSWGSPPPRVVERTLDRLLELGLVEARDDLVIPRPSLLPLAQKMERLAGRINV